MYAPPAVPPATPPRIAPRSKAINGAAGPAKLLPASVVIAMVGQVAKVAAPPDTATPPTAPATVPNPAPT